jgi:hypothetical protein
VTDQEAAAFCKQGWPGEDVTIRRVKGVCEVVAKDGSVLGRAFSWRPALQQAYKPKLDAEQARRAEIWEAARKDMELFGEFLREYLRAEFETWKVKRAQPRDKSPQPGGAQASPQQLVQEHAEAQHAGEAGPSRLILPGRE